MVDGISLHNYFGNEPELAGGKSERFLAQNLDMERQILEITAVADYVQGLYRSPKKLWLSFDEWNVWYRARTPEHLDGKGAVRAQAARRGLQPRGRAAHRRLPQYAHAPVRPRARRLPRADRQRHRAAGHQQQGHAAPVHLLPVPMVLKYARGRMLDIQVESETYPIRAAGLRPDFARDENVPFLDVVATYDAKEKRIAVFALNRDISNERELALTFDDVTPSKVLACETVTGTDLKAFNTFESPNKVVMTQARRRQGRREDVGEAAGAFVHRRPPGGLRSSHDQHSRRDALKFLGAGAAMACGCRHSRTRRVRAPTTPTGRAKYFPLARRASRRRARSSTRRSSTKPIYCGSSRTACCTTSASTPASQPKAPVYGGWESVEPWI